MRSFWQCCTEAATMTEPVTKVIINADGERVIPATRRPDGTWRKERKVKDGYIPQDEQPVYQSRGIMARQGVPLCPGMDDSEAASSKAKAQSKPAKKKEKASLPPAATVMAKIEEPRAASKPSQAKPAQAKPAPEPAPSPAPEEKPKDDKDKDPEKEARKLRKKIRECDSLVEKKAKGEALTAPEGEKLAKLAAWNAELEQLEALLPGLKI